VWFVVLAAQEASPGPWLLVAGSAAVTTSLVGVILGVRFSMQADAAERHAEVKKPLVEISWNTAFAVNAPPADEPGRDAVVSFPRAVPEADGWPVGGRRTTDRDWPA
jgi:hypothetical protein